LGKTFIFFGITTAGSSYEMQSPIYLTQVQKQILKTAATLSLYEIFYFIRWLSLLYYGYSQIFLFTG